MHLHYNQENLLLPVQNFTRTNILKKNSSTTQTF